MVSIIPGNVRTANDLLGQQTANAIQQNVQPQLNQMYQRQRGYSAIDRLQQDLSTSNGDQSKILAAIARAYTDNPSLERSGIAQYALQNAGAGAKASGLNQDFGLDLGGGQNKAPLPNFMNQQNGQGNGITPTPSNTAPPPQGKKTSNDIDNSANSYLAQIRPDLVNPSSQYGAINTFDSEVKRDLTPEEEGQIRQKLFDQKKPPEVIDSIIDRLREGIQNKYKEAQDRYGYGNDKMQERQKKWQQFTQNAPDRLAPTFEKYNADPSKSFVKTQDLLKNKYFQYAGKLPDSLTPEQMHTNAMLQLQNDINRLDALEAIPAMSPAHTAGQVKDYIDTNKPAYKALANEGFEEALKEDAINNKDMGNEEFHSTLWGDQTNKNVLNDIHKYKAPEEYKQLPYLHYNDKYKDEKENYINNVASSLSKLGPNDDLILARAMVLDNGGDIKDFGQALSKAQEKGLKLSPFQERQLQEINIPRRPPMWEIFNNFAENPGEAVFGAAGMLNWKPFINYVRGKK